MWIGKLTALDMTPLSWLGRKASTQKKKKKKSLYINESQSLLTDSKFINKKVRPNSQNDVNVWIRYNKFRMKPIITNGEIVVTNSESIKNYNRTENKVTKNLPDLHKPLHKIIDLYWNDLSVQMGESKQFNTWFWPLEWVRTD